MDDLQAKYVDGDDDAPAAPKKMAAAASDDGDAGEKKSLLGRVSARIPNKLAFWRK